MPKRCKDVDVDDDDDNLVVARGLHMWILRWIMRDVMGNSCA